jgi:hypothetical protein
VASHLTGHDTRFSASCASFWFGLSLSEVA